MFKLFLNKKSTVKRGNKAVSGVTHRFTILKTRGSEESGLAPRQSRTDCQQASNRFAPRIKSRFSIN